MMAAIEKIRISPQGRCTSERDAGKMGRPDAIWSPKGDTEGRRHRVRRGPAGSLSAFRQNLLPWPAGEACSSANTQAPSNPCNRPRRNVVEIERAQGHQNRHLQRLYGVPDAKLERNAANLAGEENDRLRAQADHGRYPRLTGIEAMGNARLELPLFDHQRPIVCRLRLAGARG